MRNIDLRDRWHLTRAQRLEIQRLWQSGLNAHRACKAMGIQYRTAHYAYKRMEAGDCLDLQNC